MDFDTFWRQCSVRLCTMALDGLEQNVESACREAWMDAHQIATAKLFLKVKSVLLQCKNNNSDASATRVAIMDALIGFVGE
jgi:hypothetical protein